MKKHLIFSIFILSVILTSCTLQKVKPKTPQIAKTTYPAILWKKRLGNPFVIVGESKRRLFILNKDENGNYFEIVSLDKNTGRKSWSEKVDISLKNPVMPWSYGVAFKGIAIAVHTKNNEIIGFDKYRGGKLWDKPVKGNGIAVLGENFITFHDNRIILIVPESGKTIEYEMNRHINDLTVTPKGFLMVLTGEVLNLVDLDNDKVKIKWQKHLDLKGGFYPYYLSATDNAVVLYEKTTPLENLLYVKSTDLSTLKNNWQDEFRGKIKGRKSYLKYADSDVVKIVVTPEIKGEFHWIDLKLSNGKKIGEHLSFKNPDSNCIFAAKTVYCTSEKGVTAYDKNMKKLWFRETIYPVNEGGHKVIKNNIVLAAGTRVKVFSPAGDTVFVYDIKNKSFKEPRVGRILGSFGGKLIFTVVDY